MSKILIPLWAGICFSVLATVTLDENFDNLDSWQYDYHGDTGRIGLSPFNNTGDNFLHSNLTYCGDEATNSSEWCYRAEIAANTYLRSSIVPDDSGIIWIGLTMRVPEDWVWLGESASRDVTYFFQLHGGDNLGNSPILGLRSTGDGFTMNICGFAARNDTGSTCQYIALGKVEVGAWVDWVAEINMVAYSNSGYVNVWRNGEQIVNRSGLATSYGNDNSPYPKLGVYQLNWKTNNPTLTQWWGFEYLALKIAYGENSLYEDVYTGSGALCGSPCDTLDDDLADTDDTDGGTEGEGESKHKDQYERWIRDMNVEVVLMAAVPLAAVAVCVCMFYFANKAIDRKYALDPALMSSVYEDGHKSVQMKNFDTSSAARAVRWESVEAQRSPRLRASTILSHQSDMSFQSAALLVSTIRDTFVWVEEEDYVHDSSFVWEEPWQATLQRKIFWYIFGYGSVLGMILFSMVLYGNPITDEDGLLPWTKVEAWTVKDIATYMTVTFTYTSIFFLPLAFLPQKIDEGKEFKNDPAFLKRIGVVIPCHKSALEIGNVLRQVLKYIPPENICVCDNGNFNWPADNTFDVVKEVDPNIQYCFISQGHKTRALWTGCTRLPPHCEYIVHLDDDTMLSDHMVFDESHFKADGGQHVSAVAFLRSSYRHNRLTDFTDFWYKITDHFHATQAKIATRAFVPGPAGLWRRDRFKEVFGAHPALPFGEDIFGGFTTLNMGYAIRAEVRCMVTTFAPDILVNFSTGGRVQGYGASSLWKQRAHRWTVSALRITGKSLYSFFTYNTKGGILSNIAFRMYRFREYKIIFVQVMYIPFCVVILSRGFYVEFFLLKFMLFLWPLLRNLYINYFCWRDSPQLQVKLQTVLLSPFFNFFLIMCAVHGRLKCLLWYIPNVPPNHGMLQRCHPRSKHTIKVLQSTLQHLESAEAETEPRNSALVASTDFQEKNPLHADRGKLPSQPGSDNDLFEFFYRDGSSAYLAGGVDDAHVKNSVAGETKRKSALVRRKSDGMEFEAIDATEEDLEAGTGQESPRSTMSSMTDEDMLNYFHSHHYKATFHFRSVNCLRSCNYVETASEALKATEEIETRNFFDCKDYTL